MTEINQVDRRDVLKGIGTTAAASSLAGAASGRVKALGVASEKHLNRARRSEYVRSILKDLKNPKLEVQGSQRYELKGTDGKTMTAAEFTTSFGTLYYVESEGEETGAMFRFSFDEATASKRPSALPEKYRTVPQGTDAVLLGRKDGVVFRRNATDAERSVIENLQRVTVEDSAVVTGSDVDGFYVLHGGEEAENDASRSMVVIEGEFDSTESLADELSVNRLTTEEQVDAQWHKTCITPCAGCVGSIGTCYECAPACADAPTGIGAVDCAVCLYLICHGALIGTCGACAHCVGGYV